MTLILEIPPDCVATLGQTEEAAKGRLLLELAIALYREGELPPGRAAKLAGLERHQFEEVLRQRKVPIPYTMEMLEEDFRYARSRV